MGAISSILQHIAMRESTYASCFHKNKKSGVQTFAGILVLKEPKGHIKFLCACYLKERYLNLRKLERRAYYYFKHL